MGYFTEDYRQFMNGRQEDVWIETGTLRAESVRRALDYGFREIYTIETNEKWYDWVTENEREIATDRRVHRYLGSSEHELPDILDQVRGRDLVFWLDAHYTGNEDDRTGLKECPLIEELKAIVSKASANVLICIDDAVMFSESFWKVHPGAQNFNRADWPLLRDIDAVLRDYAAYFRGECFYYRRK